jgi:hypothetical protein
VGCRPREATASTAARHARAIAERQRKYPGTRRRRLDMTRRICSQGSPVVRCGGGFAAHAPVHGREIVQFYGCTSFWKCGAKVCPNRMEALDAEVLATLQDVIMRPTMVD